MNTQTRECHTSTARGRDLGVITGGHRGESTPYDFIYIQHKTQKTILLVGGSQRSGDSTDKLNTCTRGLWSKSERFLLEGSGFVSKHASCFKSGTVMLPNDTETVCTVSQQGELVLLL